MALTPDEIRAKSFPTVKKGGVDPDLVTTYLESIAEEVQQLQAGLASAQHEASKAQTVAQATSSAMPPPAPAPAPAEAPRSLSVVGSHVDEVLEAAQRSADAIVRDADTWAADHKAAADTYAAQIHRQVDELRATTETQADTFRSETVAYANKIREDAEAAAASARHSAEADAAAHYERLTADLTERWEAVKAAERDLLSRINLTSSELTTAQSHFETAVARHAVSMLDATSPSVAAGEAPVEAMEAPAYPEAPAPVDQDFEEVHGDDAQGHDEPMSAFDEAPTEAEAPVEDAVEATVEHDDDPAAWTPDVQPLDAVSDEAAPPPPPPAADVWAIDDGSDSTDSPASGHEQASTWEAAEEPADSAWGNDTPATDAWSEEPDEADGAWGSPDPVPAVAETETGSARGSDDAQPDSDETHETDSSWAAEPTTSSWGDSDPSTTTSWGSEAAETADSWGATAASAGADARATASGDGETDSSFFNEGAPTATDVDDDPLAAMVRDAVDRVTEGDGAN